MTQHANPFLGPYNYFALARERKRTTRECVLKELPSPAPPPPSPRTLKIVLLRYFLSPGRCNYVYDGLGNLYKKSCGQTEVQYVIDPFGNPGADIIGQVKDF